MQHSIPIELYGPQGPAMAQAVDKCVHCGFCLSACPTYKVLGEEMDSPRGRIILMKEVLEQKLSPNEAGTYIDRCLGCMACEPACPSGVAYGELLAPYRAQTRDARSESLIDRIAHVLVHQTLPYPGRFRTAAFFGRAAIPFRSLLPEKLGAMLELLPDRIPSSQPLPDHMPAEGKQRGRVALLTGCVQQVLAPEINWATIRVLAHCGIEVLIPKQQGCCGSLGLHAGEQDAARRLATNNFKAFPRDVDAIVTNAAGCGSGMHEYPLLFAGTELEEIAVEFAAKVIDVSAYLADIGLVGTPALRTKRRLAYHDACHLAHAQRITAQPRQILNTIENLEILEIPEGELCCGSAGTYNLEQPDLAHQIGRRKAENVLSTGAEGIITGNIGCMMQIQTHLLELKQPRPIMHTMQVLDEAYMHEN